jgi:hypothetical protein
MQTIFTERQSIQRVDYVPDLSADDDDGDDNYGDNNIIISIDGNLGP